MIFRTQEALLSNMKVGDTFWYVHCSLTGHGIHIDGPLTFEGFEDKPSSLGGVTTHINYLGPNSQMGWISDQGWTTPIASFLHDKEESIVATTEAEAREYYEKQRPIAQLAESNLLPNQLKKFRGE